MTNALSTAPPRSVVEGIYTAFGRGDMAGLFALLDPDVEWGVQVDAPGAELVPMFRRGRGRPVVEGYFAGVAELEFHVFDPHDIHTDGDVVLVELTLDVSHRATGKRARFEEIHHWIVRDGRVVHYRPYADTAALIELYRPD